MADVKGTEKQGERLAGTDGADVFIFEPGRVNTNAHSPFAKPDLILKFEAFDQTDANKKAIDKIDLSALDKKNFDFVGTDAKLADADKKSIAVGYDSKNGLVVVDLDRNGQVSAGDLVIKLDNKPKELTRDNFILPQDLPPPGGGGEEGGDDGPVDGGGDTIDGGADVILGSGDLQSRLDDDGALVFDPRGGQEFDQPVGGGDALLGPGQVASVEPALAPSVESGTNAAPAGRLDLHLGDPVWNA